MRPTASAFRVLLLATVAVSPVAAQAQPSTAPAAQSGTADAIRVLLDQADYWRSQYQPERADEALERVLTLDPRNVDALAAQAQAAADRGNQKDARAALAKLQAIRPDDPRIASIQQALQVGPIDAAAIGEARQLAQTGKPDEAVAAYRKAFKGDTPPPNLAVEFYQTEASTDAGWDAARDGLAALVRSNPQDLRAQLAFAQVLTYREGTREDGVDRLATLSQQPSLKAAARKSWRDGLLWSGDDVRSQTQLETYLKDNPSDPEIESRRADLKASVPDEGARDRLAGYQAMDAKDLTEAQKDFQAALEFNNQDIEAMVMLAAIDRVHGHEADVQRLTAQAKAVDPDRAKELIDSVGLNVTAIAQGNYGGRYQGGGDYGAASRRAYANVQQLTNRGEYAAAEADLRKLMGKRPAPGSYIQLGYIQLRAGQLSDAEASFRRVLASNPRSVAALNGLAGTLSREGNTADAERIYARLGTHGGAAGLAQTRAASLRDEAHAATSADDKIRLYREAIAADPSDPWVRLELARVLLDQNKSADAHEVMEPVTSSSKPSIDQLRAGVYFADASHDYKLATRLIDRLPANARSPEMRDAAVRADVGADLQDARSAGNLTAMERRMLVLAAKPDPTGARGAAFAKALLQAGDKPGARDVIRAALNASRPPLPQQRIAYAQMLIGAGYLREAQMMTAGLQQGALSPVQRSQLTEVDDSSAVGLADTLNNRGRAADAYDQLQPRLAADPDNPDLNLALARLYQSQHQAEKALAIDEALLKQNPSSMSVKTATVFAALSAGKTGRASELVSELKSEFPDEPETWMAAAQVARARGNNGQALSDLRTAKTLRSKQMESSGSSDAAALSMPGWQPGQQYALSQNAMGQSGEVANDASSSVMPAAAEPVTRGYERYAQSQPPAPPDGALSAPPDWRRMAAATIDVTGVAPAAVPQDGPAAVLTPVAYTNPFRSSSPAPTQDEPTAAPNEDQSGPLMQRQPSDPLTADIDRSIRQIDAEMAPEVDGTLSLRGRSGEAGQAELLDLEAPLSASFSPAGYGRLKVQVTPAYLWADRATAAAQVFFGTNPLASAAGKTITRGEVQTAAGAALDVSYSYMGVTGDIGSTPIGFREASIVGGVEYAPRLTSDLTLRIVGERRAVTDSLLSYAGAKDPLSGQSWGGVTRNRGHIQLEGVFGIANYYVGGGGGVLVGEQVKSNVEFDAGAGFSLPVWKTPTQEVRTGLDLVYFGYRNNLGAFTIGNGGYFSPQQFFAALIPVSYTDHVTPDLSWGVGGSIGVQTFRARGEPIFPEDAARQAQLDVLALTNPGVLTRASGFSATGPAGGAHAEIDYAITDNLHVGGKIGFDRSGNFTEGTGLVYARYLFRDPQ